MQTKNLQQIIERALTTENIVGTSVMVARRGAIVFEQHAGWADREKKQPVTERTLFRLASMTKPLVSAAAFALLEQGGVELDAPVTRWLPTFTPKMPNGEFTPITVRHLLTHTAGLSYGFFSADNEPYRSAGVSDGLDEQGISLSENLERLATVPLLFTPGSSWHYSLSVDVLGAVLEQACQQPLSQIVAQYVTQPLAMYDTTFCVQGVDIERLAVAYADSYQPGGMPRIMQAQDQVWLPDAGPIQYAPGRITNSQAYPSGGAGMAGTARDYLKFLEVLRQGGKPILSANSVALMTEDAVSDFAEILAGPGLGHGMGFAVVRDPKAAGVPYHSVGTYQRGGVYGTNVFVDPAMELTVVILTNTALGGIEGKFPIIVERAIYDNMF